MELVVATASFHERFQARAIGLRISYQVAPWFMSKCFMELQNTSVELLLNLVETFHGGE